MQKEILFKNPVLKKVFSAFDFLFNTPLAISQISFSKKTLVENNLLMVGDAAGMITPLCGNGMSMALHSSKMAALCIDSFLQHTITRKEMESTYQRLWKKEFSNRLITGKLLQRFFGSIAISNLFVSFFRTLPFFAKTIISKTHGKSF